MGLDMWNILKLKENMMHEKSYTQNKALRVTS